MILSPKRVLHSIISNTCSPSAIGSTMCQAADFNSPVTDKRSVVQAVQQAAFTSFSVLHSKRKAVLYTLIGFLALSILSCTCLYTFHSGFRRTVQFWKGMGPLLVEYKFLKYKSLRIEKLDENGSEYKERLQAYNVKTAPKIVDLILSLGGIYVKLGQVMSTIGQGLFPPEYTDALKPLQDGVPARDYASVARIIEQSTGQSMDDIFSEFDERPIGAASIAQAHRARLKSGNGEQVIVKVQYPEVAELFDADLGNLEMFTRLFMPENMELAAALRKRHERELDFRLEAENLRECTANMQAHGVEPALVRLPRVKNETGICTQHVLVMEYLEGVPLANAIDAEQTRIAKALGHQNSQELKDMLAAKMREHFERGGGAGDESLQDMFGSGKKGALVNVAGPLAASFLRIYASVRERTVNFVETLQHHSENLIKGSNPGLLNPFGNAPSAAVKKTPKSTAHINLAKSLKTLVYVHGLQMLKDGVYNADPHPGNVLVLNDGRLGLLDYGMVGRIDEKDREVIAKTVLALSKGDKSETAKLYLENGYKATWGRGDTITDSGVLHRFATFHLDKIDLSPIKLDNGEKQETMQLFRSAVERVVPDWVEQARRLSGLLMGVHAQAARPISLAKEWEPIARESIKTKSSGKNKTMKNASK